jgi:hypothetical protein
MNARRLIHLVEAGTRAHDAWMWLSIIYAERPDLQSEFPEKSAGFPLTLLGWAVTSGVGKDSEASWLLPYKEEYEMMNRLSKN